MYCARAPHITYSCCMQGGRIYGGSYDEREAYLYMCRAALEFLKVWAGHISYVLGMRSYK